MSSNWMTGLQQASALGEGNGLAVVATVPGGDNTADRLNVSDAFLPYAVSADALIIDGPCEVSSVHCLTSSSGLLTLHDGTTSAGQKVFGNGTTAGVAFSAGDTKSICNHGAARLVNGLYADINGTFTGIIWARPL